MPRQPAVPYLTNQVRLTMWIKTPSKTLTEIHWYNSSITPDLISAAYSAAGTLVNQRSACLASGCSLVKWTLGQENVYRDAIGSGLGATVPSLAGKTENIGQDCLQLRYQASPQYRRVAYLGAVPDINVGGGLWLPGAVSPYYTVLQTYLNALAGGTLGGPPNFTLPAQQTNWGYMAECMDPTIAPVVDIVSFAFGANTPIFTVVCDEAPLVNPGDVVRISGAQGVTQLYPVNQLWTVNQVVGGTTLFLQAINEYVTPINGVVNGGTLQKKVKQFQLYSYWNIVAATTRDRGNRELTPLGRKKRKYNIGFPG